MVDWRKIAFKDDTIQTDVAPTATTAKPIPITSKRSGPSFSIAKSTPEVNPELAAEIEHALAGNTIFETLQTQLQLLEAAIPDDNLRLQTAVKSVVALSKVPEEKVLLAVKMQLDKLMQHQQKFERDLQTEVTQRTQQYKNHIDDLNKQIETNNQKQSDLQAELVRLANDLGDTQAQLGGIEAERDKVKSEFDATFAGYHERLSSMVDRLGAK